MTADPSRAERCKQPTVVCMPGRRTTPRQSRAGASSGREHKPTNPFGT